MFLPAYNGVRNTLSETKENIKLTKSETSNSVFAIRSFRLRIPYVLTCLQRPHNALPGTKTAHRAYEVWKLLRVKDIGLLNSGYSDDPKSTIRNRNSAIPKISNQPLPAYALRLMQFRSSKAVSSLLINASCPLRSQTLGS